MCPKAFIKSYFCLVLVFCAFALYALPCFAQPESIALRPFQVRQERFAKNGVLVSRPVESDQKIVDIVSQNKIHTIEDYAVWLEKNMTYQADHGKDQWLTPQEFLKIKRGDCEDFAFLNAQVLSVVGFSAHIITLSSAQNAHAICAFEHNGKFYWFDNAKLKSSAATNLTSLAQEITHSLNYLRSFELDPASKHTTLIYQRT